MQITNSQAQKLTDLAAATATHILGGETGSDNSTWAEDIAQDTLVHILGFEGEVQNIYKFCKTTAQNLAINFSKQEARRREIEELHGDAINTVLTGGSAELLAADPLEIMAYEEMRDRLDQLSPLLYSTTSRHYMDGRSIESIAWEDGCTTNTVYQRLKRARDFVANGEDDGATNEEE